MPAVVLESGFGSQYEDAPDSYEFQSRYLKFFEPLRHGETLFAVIYEPRGAGTGRMAYVGLAEVVSRPAPTGRRNRAGEELWRVDYRRAAQPFDHPVPREVAGLPVETWLGQWPRGRSRNVATFGRAVRSLTDSDFERILLLAGAPESLGTVEDIPVAAEPLEALRLRIQRVVSAFERHAAFRADVLTAYDHRCAITGLGLGGIAPAKSAGILDAAHIRPVSAKGVDAVVNGLAMTPTLHRLFDRGLFTLQHVEGTDHDLEVLISDQLSPTMISIPERGVSLGVATGTRLLLPADPSRRPRPADIAFHRTHVYRS